MTRRTNPLVVRQSLGHWRGSLDLAGLLRFLGWVIAGAMTVALAWSIVRQIHLQISIVCCQHVLGIWNDPHPELTVLLIGLGEGALLGGLLGFWIGLLHRGAPRSDRHAFVLLRAVVARLVLASLVVGVLFAIAAVLFPTPYEWLTDLPVGMGKRSDAAWAFIVGTTWGWLLGAVTCGVSAWRNPAWQKNPQEGAVDVGLS